MRRENTFAYSETTNRIPIRIYYDGEGLPTFIDERTTERVLLPPTIFFLDEKIGLSRDTLRRYSNEIYYWLCFCDANNFQYMSASELELRHYKLWMMRFQKSDGTPLGASTIDGRLYRVLEFYRWAKEKGLFFGSLGPSRRLSGSSLKRYRSSGCSRAVNGYVEEPLEGSAFLSSVSIQTIVRPLTRSQVLACYEALDHKSTNATFQRSKGRTYVRDRLIFDLMLQAGLRREEVANSITLSIFKEVEKYQQKRDEVRFSIRGKGSKTRFVSLPQETMEDLRIYSENERRRSLIALKRVGNGQQCISPNAMFLSHDYSTRPGQGLKRESVSRVVKAIFKMADRRMLEDTSISEKNRLCRHSAHDLRHTFAVLLYYSLRSQGIDRGSALKQVQMRLGHSSVDTTEDYYARFTEEYHSYDDFCKSLSI